MRVVLFLAVALLAVLGCTRSGTGSVLEPPVAAILTQELEAHGDVRKDDYYWLKERENPEVTAYLKAENAYTEARMRHTEPLQEALYEEIVGRIQPDDSTVPYKLGDYFYYSRYEPGDEYRIHCRKRGSLEAAEEVLLDVNALAVGHDFFSVSGLEVSANQNILAYSTDEVGRRIYTLQFKDLTTGELLPDLIPDVTGNVAWANDDKTVFYAKQDPLTLRSFQIYRHTLGTDPNGDVLVYEETDETYRVFVFKTKSKRYLVISSTHTLSDEVRILDADNPLGSFEVFEPRERGLDYSIDHYGDSFYIRTNDQAKNFRLMKTPVSQTRRQHWTEVIPHREGVFLSSFEIFKDHLVVSERSQALTQLRVIPWQGEGEHYLDFGEPAYSSFIATNPEFDTTVLRYVYTSMTTPRSTYDYDMVERQKELLKQDKVVGDFKPENYVTERLQATARDETRVPVSLVYRRGTPLDGTSPLLLYSYGSYGSSSNPSFDGSRLSLLDRGFVYAVAHVRGGQELGRDWYENGKLLNKKNTFTDFIDCADFLVETGYAAPGKVFAMGGSAGGLLMGAVTNMRPDRFRGVISRVPFVDVITTMLDDSIPLTTNEYDEWGDPRVKEYYDYILSYSPYDNVEAKAYPNILVTTGLHDSQVQYWEPAKYVAKLRANKTDNNLVLLTTNFEAGHGGASGRYRRHRETALAYAFILDLAGHHES